MKGFTIERKLAAYPLFVKDPYFSIWANSEEINSNYPIYWTGAVKPLKGYVEIDGKKLIFLGMADKEDKGLTQINIKTEGYITECNFTSDIIDIKVEFISPLFIDDLETLSCPVCYMRYTAHPKIAYKQAKIVFEAEERLCYATEFDSERKEKVSASVMSFEGFESAFFGNGRQMLLSSANDVYAADWGYWYVAGQRCFVRKEDRVYIVAENDLNEKGFFMLGYDDIASIDYFGRILPGYYFRNGKNISDALQDSFNNAENVYSRCLDYKDKYYKEWSPFGEDYVTMCNASLIQSIGANKLVYDNQTNKTLFFSKECGSCGCIDTLDVTYPSAPLFLLYNPELVRSMLYPIFEFAKMPVWIYPFAPHDVGLYPHCYGQFYALKNDGSKYSDGIADTQLKECFTLPKIFLATENKDYYDPLRQMPVEENANMIILVYAAYKYDGDTKLIKSEFEILKKWAEYLYENGKEPKNQLCTDDFCGRKNKNINLIIKAAIALSCFSEICKIANCRGEKYKQKAKEISSFVEEITSNMKNMPSTFENSDDTYSLKYNLVYDLLFKLELFSQKTYEKEIECYLKNIERYGVRLYSDTDFTKSDWMSYIACFSDNTEYRQAVFSTITASMKDTVDRIPFSDWYSILDGNAVRKEFRNRSVQGGIFMPLLFRKLSKTEKE